MCLRHVFEALLQLSYAELSCYFELNRTGESVASSINGCLLYHSLLASSRARGLSFCWGRGWGGGVGWRETNESLQRCLTNLNAAPNTPHGFLLAELSEFNQSAPNRKRS